MKPLSKRLITALRSSRIPVSTPVLTDLTTGVNLRNRRQKVWAWMRRFEAARVVRRTRRHATGTFWVLTSHA